MRGEGVRGRGGEQFVPSKGGSINHSWTADHPIATFCIFVGIVVIILIIGGTA